MLIWRCKKSRLSVITLIIDIAFFLNQDIGITYILYLAFYYIIYSKKIQSKLYNIINKNINQFISLSTSHYIAKTFKKGQEFSNNSYQKVLNTQKIFLFNLP